MAFARLVKFFLLLILLQSIEVAFAQSQPVSYSREDSLRVVELLQLGAKELSDSKSTSRPTPLTLFYARKLMDLPYVGQTLEIKGKEEHLAINLHALDCTTLVENCCALALTTSHGSTLNRPNPETALPIMSGARQK